MENTNAKEAILSTIRRNLAASAAIDAVHDERADRGNLQLLAETQPMGGFSQPEIVESFRENLEAVGGTCVIVEELKDVSEAAKAIVDRLTPRRIAVSDSADVAAVLDSINIDIPVLGFASAHELFECDLGITSAQWGIAETGTLVLDSAKEFNRLTSLVPEVHICILRAENIRPSMSEILELIAEDLSHSVTFVTGPSRTSDIELTLAIGVHGPRELHVIVINGTAA